MAVSVWLASVLLALGLSLVESQTGEDFTKLLSDFPNIDSRVRPVKNYSTVSVVNVSFHLMAILGFDTITQKLSSTGWLQATWSNEYTTWNPDHYGGVRSVSPNPATMWRPKLTLKNTMADLKPMGEDYINLELLPDGTTIWYPGDLLETFCRVDVTYFPFDIQICRWEMFVWGEGLDTVDLQVTTTDIILDTYVGNGEWQLMATQAWRDVRKNSTKPTPYANYEVTLRRRPTLLALTIMLPITVLAFVNVFVFTIPSESGERLSYSITVLLSFGVFMGFVLGSMPSSTENIPIMALNLAGLLVLSAIYVLLCIMSLRFFHRDHHKYPVPSVLKSFVVILETVFCLDQYLPKKNRVKVRQADVSELLDPACNPALVSPALVDIRKGRIVRRMQLVVSNADAMKSDVSDVMKSDVMGKAGAELGDEDDPDKREEASKAKDEMSWPRVSRTLDRLFFRFFGFLVLASNVTMFAVIIFNFRETIRSGLR
ncbi:neuronal acetylcholine receptor subunit alpha-7-like isoform X2 [Littorina saxatilis]|uniref:Uncharacterized protein n=2 Tax=Littorina saxatilis TaxID=31220 RepID=A0AAN9BNA6_9CAEN